MAREEDELECAIIAYKAAGKPEEAARIYEEIAAKTQTQAAEGPVGGKASGAKKEAFPSVSHKAGETGSREDFFQKLFEEAVADGMIEGIGGKKVGTDQGSAAKVTSTAQVDASTRVCACGQTLKSHWIECPRCGTNLQDLRCSNCGEPLEPEWKRCPKCRVPIV